MTKRNMVKGACVVSIASIKKSNLLLTYEIMITTLALFAVILALLGLTGQIVIESSNVLSNIDLSILLIFAIDYTVRLVMPENRKQFIKENIFDLIAIIPFNSLFRFFRMARLFRVVRLSRFIRLIRLVAFAKKFKDKINRFLHTNGFIYVLYLTITTVLLGAIGIYLVEQEETISTFGDAIWWSFVTATTVGYGDISPATTIGRIIASVLMLVGIGFIGMLTGTIATFFISNKETVACMEDERIIDVSDLNKGEIKDVIKYIEFIKSRRD